MHRKPLSHGPGWDEIEHPKVDPMPACPPLSPPPLTAAELERRRNAPAPLHRRPVASVPASWKRPRKVGDA